MTEQRKTFLENNLGSWKEFILNDPQLKEALNEALDSLISLGDKISPLPENILNAFKYCPIDKLHTVIIGWNPDPRMTSKGAPIANGLTYATDVNYQNIDVPVYINNIVSCIELSIVDENIFLDRLKTPLVKLWGKPQAEKGMLMLNYNLTINPSSLELHVKREVWHKFTSNLVKKIKEHFPEIKIIVFGQKVKEKIDNILNTDSEFLPEMNQPLKTSEIFLFKQKINSSWF